MPLHLPILPKKDSLSFLTSSHNIRLLFSQLLINMKKKLSHLWSSIAINLLAINLLPTDVLVFNLTVKKNCDYKPF